MSKESGVGFKSHRQHFRHVQDDDSSDDEAVTNALYGEFDEENGLREGGYDLHDQWLEFCRGYPENASDSYEGLTGTEQKYWRPSFLMHAFGIGLLYSQEINEHYYGSEDQIGLKEKYLSDVRKEGDVKAFVEKALNKINANIFSVFFHYDWESKNAEKQEIVSEVQKSLSQEKGEEDLQDYIELVSENLAKVIKDFIFDGVTFSDSQDAVENMSKSSKAFMKRKLLNLIISDLENIGVIKENEIQDTAKKNQNPHKFESQTWTKKSRSKEIDNIFDEKKLYQVKETLKKKKKGQQNFEDQFDDEMLVAYFEDITAFATSEYDDVNSDLFDDFIHGLCQKNLAPRKTLPHKFSTDAIEDTVDFLSQIRLSNRSKFREVKNIKDSLGREDFLQKDAFSRMKRYWKFNDGIVAEEDQLISSVAIARDGQVTILDNRSEGAYSTLNQTLSKVIKEFNDEYCDYPIADKDIAQWVRDKLVGKPFQLEQNPDIERIDADRMNQFITEFTYLLFGCEVARNPAALVEHQMMLDLIIDEKLKWRDCLNLTGKLPMPMAMTGAVQAARASHSKFADHMPWPYRYDGDGNDEKMDQLVKAEKKLLRVWCLHKGIHEDMLEESLRSACKDWYGIDLMQVMDGTEDYAKNVIFEFLESNTPKNEVSFALMNDLLKESNFSFTPAEKEDFSMNVTQYVFDEFCCEEHNPGEKEREFFELLAKKELFDFSLDGPCISGYSTLPAFIERQMDVTSEIMIFQLSVEFLEENEILLTAANCENARICKSLVNKGVTIPADVADTNFYKENNDIFQKDSFDLTALSTSVQEIEEENITPSRLPSSSRASRLAARPARAGQEN